MSEKDVLFLLPPGFAANDRREYCPECAEVWGLLHYYPALKEVIEIRYVGIDHPRQPICDLLGDGRWNAPTLVLAQNGSEWGDSAPSGRKLLGSAKEIAAYFATLYGTPVARGS